jgi:ComF family protein
MPLTGYGDLPDNPVSQIFWGRVPVERGTSLLKFEKGSAYQLLLHDLKYRGNRKTGVFLGRKLGIELEHTLFSSANLIVPVPIHRKKMRERGYNQSEIIARGVSEVTGVPLETGLLERTTHSGSQTALGRYERYENVSGNFRIAADPPDVNGLSILLIDDVVTTGATLEACTEVLLKAFECKVLIATVANA